METKATLEGLKKVIFFPFQAAGWGTKALIGSALAFANYLIPLVPWLPLLGYAGQISRQVATSEEDPRLPEWDEWNNFFADGLKILGAGLIYQLPAILLLGLGVILILVSVLIPSGNFSDDTSLLIFGVGYIGGLTLLYLGMIVIVALTIFMSPALAHMLVKGEFRAAFAIGEWWPLFKNNWSAFLLTPLLVYTLNIGITLLSYLLYASLVLCLVAPFFVAFGIYFTTVVYFALIGIAYRDSLQRQTTAIETV